MILINWLKFNPIWNGNSSLKLNNIKRLKNKQNKINLNFKLNFNKYMINVHIQLNKFQK